MKEMRLGLVGTGDISARLCEAAREGGLFRPAAVLSRTRARGEEFAAQNGVSSVFCEEEAFLSSDIDAVYIATPNCLHEAGAVAALSRGKHVLCEKPVATDAAAWARMKEAAKESGCVLLEAMRPMHDPVAALLRENLPRVGRVRQVRFSYCQYSSRYDAFRAGEVRRAFDPSYGNAAVMDIGVYPVALSVYLFGRPRAVQAASVFLPNGFEGSGEALLTYGDFTVSVGYSKIVQDVSPSVILGEDGALTLDCVNNTRRVAYIPRGGVGEMRGARPCGGEEALPYAPRGNNMVYELQDFHAAIEGRVDLAPFTAASDDTVYVLDEIRKSAGIHFS